MTTNLLVTHISQNEYVKDFFAASISPSTKMMSEQENVQDISQIISQVEPISNGFTFFKSLDEQRECHNLAKKFLIENLPKINSDVQFVSHQIQTCAPSVKDVDITNVQNLDQSVFSYEFTKGVKEDIERSGAHEDSAKVFLYSAASQFNGCEASSRYTVDPGRAVAEYQLDKTQGPQAQLSFQDHQVELINCAGNLGFNGLVYVLDEETKGQVQHGYFTPIKDKSKKVIEQLQTNGHLLEAPCIGGIPNNGKSRVYEILVAAPAFGGYSWIGNDALDQEDQDEIEFLCALHAFRIQFHQAVNLAQSNKKPVELKAAGVGLGVFGNTPLNVAKAFYTAAIEYQEKLKENSVEVKLQVFRKDENSFPNAASMEIAQLLNLSDSSLT